MLFESVVFGSFVAFLCDYWLGRATVKEPVRLIISVAVGIIVAFLIEAGKVSYF